MRLRDHPAIRRSGMSVWPPLCWTMGDPPRVFPPEEGVLVGVERPADRPGCLVLVAEYLGHTGRCALELDSPHDVETLGRHLGGCVGMRLADVGERAI